MTEHRGAHLSDDKVYRYTLSRSWDSDLSVPEMTWVMLNPSTADAELDDPTIRRCKGFAKLWGYGGIRVVNLFALRATDPKQLLKHPDPVGPDNDFWVSVATGGRFTMVGWGTAPLAQARARALVEANTLPETLYCLGRTKSGAPKHPLYVPANTDPVPWRP